MNANPLQKLNQLGQSIWYDYIRRDLVSDGRLAKLIREDALTGMTSNPTIFQKAIADTELYDDDIRRLAGEGRDTFRIFEGLAVADVSAAADVFRPVFDRTKGDDGYVSIEVGPHLALDTEGTIREARSLWKACARPNVMVKIPGNKEGVPAIRQCVEDGININITLLFSVERYREVMEAYIAAMEARVSAGKPVESVRSVASFFVSRVDTMANKKLDARAKDAATERERALAKELRSKLGIANARLAFQAFEETFGGTRFAPLSRKGVKRQKPLWASTSTKDPSLPDLYYVEALIAPGTIDTMPPETLDAFRDHGDPKIRIEDDLPGAKAAFRGLEELGIDEAGIFRDLEEEGIRKFSDSYDSLMKTLGEKQRAVGVA
jgi:transaldolase/transaldolase/glucose-6-phosphate isomerase